MPDRITKVQRWLDLIAYLVGRRLPVSVEELMERIPGYARDWVEGDERTRASVRRKFERDKDELRAFGIPLETVRYRVGALQEEVEGYRIQRKDFYLPYLRLLGQTQPALASVVFQEPVQVHPDEAFSAVEGLRALSRVPAFPLAAAARSALRKITFDLDPEAVGQAPVVFAVSPESRRAAEYTRILADAIQRRKRAFFTYHGIRRGTPTSRRVQPWGLLFQHSHWYLVAWDEDREAERVFRVDRMEGLRIHEQEPHTPDFPPGPENVMARYRDRKPWELGDADEAVTARVHFSFPTSLWAERNGFGRLVEDLGEGGTVREFLVRQVDPFLRWVLSLAGDAEILSPTALREAFFTMARQVASLYPETAGGQEHD